MKRILLLICVVVTFFMSLSAQDFQGKAYYESKTSVDFNFGGRQIPEDRKKMILERMKQASEKTFILTFNRSESVYKEEEKLEQPGTGHRGMRFAMMSAGGEDYYKNVQIETYIVKTELLGKVFRIKDSLRKFKWEMQAETKKIGNYTVHKATAHIKVKRPSMSAIFSKPGKQQQEMIEKDIEVVAWYCLEIPVNQGPAEYWGLPGLILELQNDKTSILCSKIVLNPSDKVEIKEPKGGKLVNQEKYNEIAKKKMDELRESGGFKRPVWRR